MVLVEIFGDLIYSDDIVVRTKKKIYINFMLICDILGR